MSLAPLVRRNRSASDNPVPRIVVDVRKVGYNVFEAHDSDGYFSAIGFTAREAAENLRSRLPRHEELLVWFPGARHCVPLTS